MALLGACSSESYGPPPCRSNKGALNLTAQVAGCPKLSSWEILPREVDVGSSVQLLAAAAAAVGENVAFTWSTGSVDAGVIADPHAASTTFECTDPGEFTVEVQVVNAQSPNDGCKDVGTGSVQCDLPDGGAL